MTSKIYARDARMALASALLKRYFVAQTLFPETESETETGWKNDGDDGGNDDSDTGSGGGSSSKKGKKPRRSTAAWDSINFERKGDVKHGKPVVAESCLVECAEAAKTAKTAAAATIAREGKETGVEVKQPYIDFNISHQAGLVVLVGTTACGVEVGVDVTCVDERDDMASIRKRGVGVEQDGFGAWVDVYEQVLSSREMADLKGWLPVGDETTGSGTGNDIRSGTLYTTHDSETVLRMKLRRFYTLWAYKEAYLKMTGEALLADWVKELEFDNLRAPRPSVSGGEEDSSSLGEKVTDVVPKRAGEKISGTTMEIQAFEENYLIATAIRSEGARFHVDDMKYSFLNIDDIVTFATGQRTRSRM